MLVVSRWKGGSQYTTAPTRFVAQYAICRSTNSLKTSATYGRALLRNSEYAAHRAGGYGPPTGKIELYAKTSWVSLRGRRYQVLEEEFFSLCAVSARCCPSASLWSGR